MGCEGMRVGHTRTGCPSIEVDSAPGATGCVCRDLCATYSMSTGDRRRWLANTWSRAESSVCFYLSAAQVCRSACVLVSSTRRLQLLCHRYRRHAQLLQWRRCDWITSWSCETVVPLWRHRPPCDAWGWAQLCGHRALLLTTVVRKTCTLVTSLCLSRFVC